MKSETEKKIVCSLCPRKCGAERTASSNKGGFCGLPLLPAVCRAAPHYWEEPCLSGRRGSGAVFFSGCTLRCEYCQNAEISRDYRGRRMNARELAGLFAELEESGVHNINLVSPTPYYTTIIEALAIRKPGVPVICNTSGYERVETLKSLEGLIDIYLPDLKYAGGRLAKEYSDAEDYPEHAAAALKEMYRQAGKASYDADGMMISGMIIRHLVLPGNTENSLDALDMISRIVPRDVPLSIMAQYFPTGNEKHPELARRLTPEEYEKVTGYALMLGFTNSYIQQPDSADKSYVPGFDTTPIPCP